MRRDSGFVGGAGGAVRAPLTALEPGLIFERWLDELSEVDPERLDEAGALAAVTALERVKRAAAATQARLSVRAARLARERHVRDGVPQERQGAGVGAQVALARMESPHRGGQHLGLARTLTSELPHTLAALQAGRVSEWRATIIARETACLDAEVRRRIDAEIADWLESGGDRQTEREVRRRAYAADPGAAVPGPPTPSRSAESASGRLRTRCAG